MPRDLAKLRAWKKANRAKLNAQQKAYEARHPERVKASHRKYYEAHAEEICAEKRAYRQNHHDERLAYERAYYASHREQEVAKVQRSYWRHRERILATLRARHTPPTDDDRAKGRRASKLHRTRYPERVAARVASWAKAHPENRIAINERRRARIADAATNDATAEHRALVVAAAAGVCPYCAHYNPGCQACTKKSHKLTIDHITAIVNGGDNTLHNLIACCRSCNSKKHRNDSPIPVQPLLL